MSFGPFYRTAGRRPTLVGATPPQSKLALGVGARGRPNGREGRASGGGSWPRRTRQRGGGAARVPDRLKVPLALPLALHPCLALPLDARRTTPRGVGRCRAPSVV